MEGRLSGKIMPTIFGTSDMEEQLKKIEILDILSDDEKDMLFLVTQMAFRQEKEQYIVTLEYIIKSGTIFPDRGSSYVIQQKINKINNKDKQEIIDIAEKLKKYIEDNEIEV